MASLLNWLGNAASRAGNTINNDVIQPINRDVVQPINHTVVQPIQHVVAPVERAAFNTFAPVVAPAFQAAQHFAAPISNDLSQTANFISTHIPNIPVIKPITTHFISPMLNSYAQTIGHTGQLLNGHNPYHGSIPQIAGQFGTDALNAASFLPIGAGIKGVRAGITGAEKLAPRVARSALTAGGFGGVYGIAGAAQQKGATLKSVAKAGLENAALGGAIGAGLPLGARGLSAGTKGAVKAFETRTPLNDIGAVGKNVNVKTILGSVRTATINAAKKAFGIDVTGYNHTIDNYAINHTLKAHSNLTNEDIKNIPKIINNPDHIYNSGTTPQGLNSLTYHKTINGHNYYVEEVRTGKQELAMNTMYKQKNPDLRRVDAIYTAPTPTSVERSAAQGSSTMLSPKEEKINPPQVGLKQTRFTSKTIPKSTEVSAPVKKAVNATYKAGTNAEKIAASDKLVQNNISKATELVNSSLSKKAGTATPQEISNAIHVAKAHDAAGNTDTATGIYNKVAQHLTAAGQTVQAGALLLRRSAEGLRNSAVKAIEAGGKTKVTPDLQSQIDTAYKAIKGAKEGSNERAFAVQDLQKIVNNNVKHSKLDQAFTLWRTGLLTGPLTASKVAVSHTLLNTAEKIKDIPAVALDIAISPFSGVRSTALTARGVGSGALEGAKAGIKLLRTGHDTPGTSALGGTYEDLARPQTTYGTSKLGKATNFYTQKVGQFHAAIPKGFYRSAYENDLYKQGTAQGLKGSALKDFVSKPSEIADQQAHIAAQKATFQQPSFLGKAAGQLQKVPGGRVLVPFARIASAILTDVKDYSPVGAMQSVFDAAKASRSGWTPQIQKALVEGIGRGVTGTGVVALGAELFKHNVITTGYPTSPKERALWAAEGKQENSILVNGKWEKTDALGPFGSLLAAGALFQSSKGTNAQGKSNAASALTGALTNFSGQSFLSGLTQGASALQNPQQNLKGFAKLEAGSVVPVGVGQVAAALDKNTRTSGSIGGAIESKIPGLREKLPVAQTPFGQPIKNGNYGIGGVTNPLRPTNALSDPVTNELQRLTTNLGTSPVPIPVPVTKLSGVGTNGATKSIPLTKAQQSQFTTIAGPQMQSAMQSVLNSPGYNKLSDNSKASALSTAKTDAENIVKAQMFSSINGGKAQLTTNQQSLLKGSPVDYVQKAKIAADKASFLTSGKNFQTTDNTVFQRDAAGNVTATPVVKYQESVNSAQLTNYKDQGNLNGYLQTAQKQLQNLQQQYSDPNTTALEKITLQNKAYTLQKDIAKYNGYGGFTKASGTKSGSTNTAKPKIPNFKIASSKIKAPKVKAIKVSGAGSKAPKFKIPKATTASARITVKSRTPKARRTPPISQVKIPKSQLV